MPITTATTRSTQTTSPPNVVYVTAEPTGAVYIATPHPPQPR